MPVPSWFGRLDRGGLSSEVNAARVEKQETSKKSSRQGRDWS